MRTFGLIAVALGVVMFMSANTQGDKIVGATIVVVSAVAIIGGARRT